jgi:hypothetical protein
MSRTRRPHRDAWKRNKLRVAVGLPEERRPWSDWLPLYHYTRPYSDWHEVRKPGKDLCDRVFCAFLLTGDMTLAIQIGNRNKTLESAIEHAKAIALLKETGSA